MKTLAAKKNESERAYEKSVQGWRYTQEKNEDSIVTERRAWLYSDQSLANFENGTGDLVSDDVSLMVSDIDQDSSLSISVPERIRPFAMKRSRIAIVRFDSDTTISIRLSYYTDGGKIITLPSPLVSRVRDSHKLTVMLTTAANPDSTVQFTFHTAGLKW